MIDVESVIINIELSCDLCGKKDRLLHQIIDYNGTIQNLHCDDCCNAMIDLWEQNNLKV